MTTRVATYTAPEGGRQVYYRADIAFPHGVTVTIDAEAIGPHGMEAIERDPRLKVSDVPAEAVHEAAVTDVEMTAEEVTAYEDRLIALFPTLPQDAYRTNGVPKVGFVRDALGVEDRPHLTAELIDRAWARRTTQPLAPVADSGTATP